MEHDRLLGAVGWAGLAFGLFVVIAGGLGGELERLMSGYGSLVMLDGIEDPYNLGQALRAVYAAGVDGLIVRARSWERAAGIVARASAGASELLPTAAVTSPEEAAEQCRGAGLTVACATTRSDATFVHDANLAVPLLLLVGGERRGVTRSFTDSADLLLRIPYGRRGAHALGAATSAALLAFEALRQRRAAGIAARNEA